MPHENYLSCIEACHACTVACHHCAASCLRDPELEAMKRCIALDLDCAETCAYAAAMMARDSQYARAICALCAKVCEECGTECAKHEAQHCQECARACQECAQVCRAMA